MVLIAALFEMVTEVGALLLVNVAVPTPSGTRGLELQLVPVVHSAPGPVQVPSTACAVFGANIASAPSQTLPSIAARLRSAGADVVAIRIALSRSAAPGAAGAAARVACGRH
jgi:hypothetical protein